MTEEEIKAIVTTHFVCRVKLVPCLWTSSLAIRLCYIKQMLSLGLLCHNYVLVWNIWFLALHDFLLLFSQCLKQEMRGINQSRAQSHNQIDLNRNVMTTHDQLKRPVLGDVFSR